MAAGKFLCNRCGKGFASKRNLNNHQNKSLPCDLICKVCNVKYEDRFAYYRHLKNNVCVTETAEEAEECQNDKEDENGIVLLSNMQPVPLNDFVDGPQFQELLKFANRENCEIEVERITEKITIKPNKSETERVFQGLRQSDFMCSLKSLCGSPEEAVIDSLIKVHTDPTRPQFHSICLGDLSRKTVNCYTRPQNQLARSGNWQNMTINTALIELSRHASNLLSLLLNNAVNCLTPAYYDEADCVCFSTHHNEPSNEHRGIIVYAFGIDDNNMEVDVKPVDYYSPCPEEKLPHARRLLELIERKKEAVIEKVRHYVLNERDLSRFLERTRPTCLEVFQGNK